MEKTKVVITLERGLITVYSDFPEHVSVEVIDLDVEDPDYERAEQASQCLERVEIEEEDEGDEYGYHPDDDEDETVTSRSVDCPCDCTECEYADKCSENGRYDFSDG